MHGNRVMPHLQGFRHAQHPHWECLSCDHLATEMLSARPYSNDHLCIAALGAKGSGLGCPPGEKGGGGGALVQVAWLELPIRHAQQAAQAEHKKQKRHRQLMHLVAISYMDPIDLLRCFEASTEYPQRPKEASTRHQHCRSVKLLKFQYSTCPFFLLWQCW